MELEWARRVQCAPPEGDSFTCIGSGAGLVTVGCESGAIYVFSSGALAASAAA